VGILLFVFTIPGALIVDKVGRKPMLYWSLANMAIAHAIIAALVATYGDSFHEHKGAANGAVFMVYWIIVNYALPYGPVGWVVTAESSSLDIRAKGIAIGSAVNWIMNFAVAMVTPVMLGRIGYKAFLVFMCFCALGLLWVYFVLPELKGLTLEEIDAVFADEESMEDRIRRQRIGEELGIWTVADVVLEDQMTDKQGDLQRVEG
jgi:MFS family permease